MAQGIARWRRGWQSLPPRVITRPIGAAVLPPQRSPRMATLHSFASRGLHAVTIEFDFVQPLAASTSSVSGGRIHLRQGSASASRRLGYLSPEASLSAMLGVQTAGEGLVRLESAKVLDA